MKHVTLILLALSTLPSLAIELTVQAGPHDRTNTIVPLTLPDNLDTRTSWHLRSAQNTLPIQIIDNKQALFLLDNLKANQSRTYTLEQVKSDPGPEWLIAEADNVTIAVGKASLRYNGAKTPLPAGFDPAFARGGYIHPVTSPGGKLVTDDYPPAHKHHHGIWFPWTATRFEDRKPDFWNMGQKTGTVEFVELESVTHGALASGFTTKHRFVDLSAKPNPKPALNETWQVTAYRLPKSNKPLFVFDLVSTQTCATDTPLLLPKYYYGGVGYRGHRDWDGAPNCFFLTSEGKTRENGNETTGKWVHIGGKVDGQLAGAAILCHPSNFRFPQPLRIHPKEPFVCYAPQQQGDMAIKPGQPYTSQYRYVIADGPADKDLIERLWNDYANPPQVVIK
jgi:hypothetical protein